MLPKWCLAKSIYEGEASPKGYGLSWFDMMRNRVIIAPIPLNIIYGWLREIWIFLRMNAQPGWVRQWESRVRNQAYTDGYNRGCVECLGRVLTMTQTGDIREFIEGIEGQYELAKEVENASP